MNSREFYSLIESELGQDAASRLFQRLAHVAGGEVLYLPKRPPVLSPVPDPRLTPREICARYGVSRKTAYRWAAKWRAVKVSMSAKNDTGKA